MQEAEGKTVTRPEIDPEIATFIATMARSWANHPPFMDLSLPEARAIAEQVRAPWAAGGPVMQRTEEHGVPTRHGIMRVRVYDPGAARPAGIFVYIHGGGWTLFSLDTHDRLMREYAAAADCLVVGIDYPLSPETRYPIAAEMVVDAIDWLASEGAAMIGGDPKRIVIGGDSAGGNLSITTALRLRDRGTPGLLSGMLLNYAVLDAHCSDEAERIHGGAGSVLDRAEMDFYLGNYLGDDAAVRADPYAVPMKAILSGLPPAFLVIPECDILSEQSIEMVDRLTLAGVPVTSKVYPGATHSFLEAMSIADVARRAIADGAAWVAGRLAA